MKPVDKIVTVLRAVFNADARFKVMMHLGLCDNMPDAEYLRKFYRFYLKRDLNLENPLTFSEKLQWLKLYDRKDIYTTMVDKYLVKEYVAKLFGKEYVIPTLGVWDSFDDINFERLPNKFVLKCNHDSASIVVCKDKNSFDKVAANKKLTKNLKKNGYLYGREWPYKNVNRRILAEKFMEYASAPNEALTDYKFYCFNGECKFVQVEKNIFNALTKYDAELSLYDLEWHLTKFQRIGHRAYPDLIKKPLTFDKMVEFSNILSRDIPFCRIDWYDVDGSLYFGEMTFYPGSGLLKFEPAEYDTIIGSWIDLKSVKEMNN